MALTAHGKAWERRLNAWHARYLTQGVALIVKTEPPVRVGHNGKPIGWGAVGPVDYIGIANGRGVFFDAKATKHDRWRFSDLADHQARMLTHAVRIGAASFIALRCPAGDFVLHWPDIEPAWRLWRSGDAKRGGASLSAEDIESIGRRMDADGWLSCL